MKNNSIVYRIGSQIGGIFLGLFLILSTSLMAQQQAASGKVKGSDGGPVIGASVSVVGTSRGASTDGEGNFKINVSRNETLRISSIGYNSTDVVYTGQKSIDVTLTVDNKTLNEIVVVGYGSQNKKEITGAVQTISYKDLKDLPVTQIGQKLQGQLAGVQINQTTGKP